MKFKSMLFEIFFPDEFLSENDFNKVMKTINDHLNEVMVQMFHENVLLTQSDHRKYGYDVPDFMEFVKKLDEDNPCDVIVNQKKNWVQGPDGKIYCESEEDFF